MKTTALRLYGKDDLRLETFDLPDIGEDEILADIQSNSICMSTYKATRQGAEHKRVPDNVAENPIIVGHEFCGTILKVGKRWAERCTPGQKYSVQPALVVAGRELDAPGYSFPYIGGHATHVIIPREVMEQDCLLGYDGESFFEASLSEPVSCIIGAFNTNYHFKHGQYEHNPGILAGGAMAILAGAGPMGLSAIDYALHGPRKPSVLVVTDIDRQRLDRAASIFTPDAARAAGVALHYIDTSGPDAVTLMKEASGGKGFDDVFVFAPVAPLIEQASAILGYGGCLNFFAGPSKSDFKACINFYDVHYADHHVVGSSGGNTHDMREALQLMGQGRLRPSVMITHVGGIDSARDTIMDLPSIPGGKKLVYTHISMPMTAIDDFEKLGESDPFFAQLHRLVAANKGLWSLEAERFLLENGKRMNL